MWRSDSPRPPSASAWRFRLPRWCSRLRRKRFGAEARASSLINLLHEALRRFPRAFIASVRLARRHLDLYRPHVVIGDLLEQVRDAVEPRALLVVGVDDVPRR